MNFVLKFSPLLFRRDGSGNFILLKLTVPVNKWKSVNNHKISKRNNIRERWKYHFFRWLKIDESSVTMVRHENLRLISLVVQEFKYIDWIFWGINFMLSEDNSITSRLCFKQPPWLGNEIRLWREFSSFKLTVNTWQRKDTTLIYLFINISYSKLMTVQ